MSTLPPASHSLFWNVEFERLDVERDASHILTRILEYGGIDHVRWAIATYGLARIHAFLRTSGSPELTDRTLHFWRCVLNAKEEEWASPPDWRRSSSAPWID